MQVKKIDFYIHIYSHFYAFSQYINMNAMNTNNLNWNLAYTEILKENYGKWLSKIDVLKCNKYSELIAACFGLACSDTWIHVLVIVPV